MVNVILRQGPIFHIIRTEHRSSGSGHRTSLIAVGPRSNHDTVTTPSQRLTHRAGQSGERSHCSRRRCDSRQRRLDPRASRVLLDRRDALLVIAGCVAQLPRLCCALAGACLELPHVPCKGALHIRAIGTHLAVRQALAVGVEPVQLPRAPAPAMAASLPTEPLCPWRAAGSLALRRWTSTWIAS